ncbi:MAG TPA: xanthine dehydrogenase accessory protein XdhC [Rhodobacteraceae bacterium]|nr:xanthine dehydrogenase accessory protein XdhC [Paracoccaceae bacterium]HBV55719.1 xanthine dehydrogenase accessory protein XdhC [Paracoccaceae bacterium]
MTLHRAALAAAIATHGRVIRIALAEVHGSAPREVGASMLVWSDGQSGTIGGGALEHEAIAAARRITAPTLINRALGPDLGQCCGGRVTLVLEPFTASSLAAIPETGSFTRPIAPAGPIALAPPDHPHALAQARATRRAQAMRGGTALKDGWFTEPLFHPKHSLWIWGAGHVGRALVTTLTPLPDLAITWIDTDATRFPDTPPPEVSRLWASDPARLATHAPTDAHHLILTYSHAIDLALCDALLRRGAASIGLIGSATKWARFRTRLSAMGHSPATLSRITCPIGDPGLGKHPQAIALGVGHRLLTQLARPFAQEEQTA